VQDSLPQPNSSFLEQLFVEHAAAGLAAQNHVDQSLVLVHQGIQADLAPRLSTSKSDWVIQEKWVYNGH
jgi:hypothetical protein